MATDPVPDPTPDDFLRRLSQRAPTVSRYSLDIEIARGGMGSIMKVWDDDLRRHLAMKILIEQGTPTSTGATPTVEDRLLARFLEEAQVTGQLDHPGIVPVHELGLDSQGRVYFTMKLVKGRDLKTIFDLVFTDEEGWNETRALGVILKACEALAYAHSKGVIHRDLKPANVMVGNFGEVYVMDWGLSRVLGRKDAHDIRIKSEFATSLHSVKTERRETREDAPDSPIVTMDGDVIGTPTYMSPEQARGEIEKLSPRSDVYAIGAMLYHLLARQVPYMRPGARISSRTVLSMVLLGPPPPLTSLRKELPAELVAIVEKAMAREASDRYPDTLALAEDLRAYVEHRVVGAYETGALAEAKKWVQRNKPLAASFAAIGLSLLAGLLVVLWQKGKADANARLATQKAHEVLSLSSIQDLKDLLDEAPKLWPAHPEMIPRYERWLEQARALIDGQPAGPDHGNAGTVSLVQHRATLAEIRTRALPRSAADAERERAAHPQLAQWKAKQAELTWRSRMLGLAAWPSEAEAEASFAQDPPPNDVEKLNTKVWNWVDPDKRVFGHEVEAVLLARRNVEAAVGPNKPLKADTLAWALYKLGRFDEALSVEQRAAQEVTAQRRDEVRGNLARLEKLIAGWRGETALAARRAERDALALEVEALERAVNSPLTWEFESREDRWWNAQLSKLVSDLEALQDPKTGLYSSGISPEHGWCMRKRYDFARTIEERSVSGADAQSRWSQAIAAIAQSEKYRGVKWPSGDRLVPQMGLLPIGEDRASGLWEFAHLQSGAPAERDADGRLVLAEDTGLVFVLIPGGTFWMGAQAVEKDGINYDPSAELGEGPVHEVTLSPYFLSKYEMTQGQWERCTGRNPSHYGPNGYGSNFNHAGKRWTALHPVEKVTWTVCIDVVSRLGLALPSEAQWENAARAGTSSPWWTGRDVESLKDAANLLDAYAHEHGFENIEDWEEFYDDGNTVPAEVGSFRANAFGLHDVAGNLWEWCHDAGAKYSADRQTDPVSRAPTTAQRIFRSGNCAEPSTNARSAKRSSISPSLETNMLGLRPARAVSAR